LPKVTKSGEHASATHIKTKRERKRPYTPKEKEDIINCIEKIKVSTRLLPGTQIEISKKEIEQQEQSLTPYEEIMQQPNNRKNRILRNLISELFCTHSKSIIKDGYRICPDCKSKWRMENVSKSK